MLITLCLSLIAAAVNTTAPTSAAATGPSADSGIPTVVLVVGAEGTPEYGKDFATWADRWVEASQRRSAQLVQIGRSAGDSQTEDRERLKSVLEMQPREGTDPLWLILIGHGTFDGKDAKFNLRGPDISDTELADWLRPIHRPMVVIDCSSCSGPYLNRLAGKGRIIVTATRTGSEIQFAHFGDFLSSAILDPAADLDKDGQTSLLEAFLAAVHRLNDFYKQASRLSPEHALMDDNGDGLGVSADWFEGLRATRSTRDGAPIDGMRAHQVSLVLSATELAMPQDLRARRDELELQVEALRLKKKSLPEDQYYGQLEKILLQLAQIYTQGAAATAPAAQ